MESGWWCRSREAAAPWSPAAAGLFPRPSTWAVRTDPAGREVAGTVFGPLAILANFLRVRVLAGWVAERISQGGFRSGWQAGGIPSECRVNTMSALFTNFLCVHPLAECIFGGCVCVSARCGCRRGCRAGRIPSERGVNALSAQFANFSCVHFAGCVLCGC